MEAAIYLIALVIVLSPFIIYSIWLGKRPKIHTVYYMVTTKPADQKPPTDTSKVIPFTRNKKNE